MNGMDIQMLDGIDIQMLDGNGEYDGPLNARQRKVVSAIDKIARRQKWAREQTIRHSTNGVTNALAAEAASVAEGLDLEGYDDNDIISNDENLREHIQRTKDVIDAAPIVVMDYQRPADLSRMLGYVLNNWDTPNREQAIANMAAEESKLIDNGQINVDFARDYNEDLGGGVKEASNNTKKGFFNAIKRAHRANLDEQSADLVAANPATTKTKRKLRSAVASVRKNKIKSVSSTDGKTYVSTNKATSDDVAGVGGLSGVDDDMTALLTGVDMVIDESATGVGSYLARTLRVAETRPDVFETPDLAQQTVIALRKVISVWNQPKVRDAVMAELSSESSALNGKLKNALKKAASKVKSAVQKVGQAVKKAAKKVGSAVKKVTKKIVKLVVRFNPLTLLIRGGLLLFCRLNMFKAANKFYPGAHFANEAEAVKNGVDSATYKASVEAYGHIKNAYTKIGGKESKLKGAIEKGNKKKWTGTEYPTDANAVKTAGAAAITDADVKESEADINAETRELEAKGAVSDSTAPTDRETESKNVTVEIVENERTAKAATSLRETDETTGKVLVSIPKGAKVLVDTAQTSEGFIAATYNGKSGWVTTGDLAGLGACDAESVAVLMAGHIYDEYQTMPGLGMEPVTATGLAAAASTIAGIMAKIKPIFEKIKSVASKAKEAVSTAKEIKNTVTSATSKSTSTASTASAAASNNAEVKSSAASSSLLDKLKLAASKASNAVSTVKNAAATTKNVASAVKSVATPTAVSKVVSNAVAQEPAPAEKRKVVTVSKPQTQQVVSQQAISTPVATPVISSVAQSTPTVAQSVARQTMTTSSPAKALQEAAQSVKDSAQNAVAPTTTATSNKMPWIIGGAVVATGIVAWALTRKK